MDQELLSMFSGMYESLRNMRQSFISGNETANQSRNSMIVIMERQTNVLMQIRDVLSSQLDFMKQRERESEFEMDINRSTNIEKPNIDSDDADEPAKENDELRRRGRGGQKILAGLGVGMGILARGIAAFGNPTVTFGIANIGLLIGVLGTAIGLVARFFGSDIADFIGNLVRQIGLAIVDIAAYVGENKDSLMDAVDVFIYFADQIVNVFANFIRAIRPLIRDILEILGELIEDIVEILVEGLVEITENLGDDFVELIEIIADAFNEFVDTMVDALRVLQPVLMRLLNVIDNVVSRIADVLIEFRPVIQDIVRLFETVVTEIGSVLRDLISQIDPILGRIRDIIETVGGEIEDVVRTVFTSLESFIDTVGGRIESFVGTLFGGLESNITSFGNVLEGIISTTLGGISDIIGSIGDTVEQIFNALTNTVERLSQLPRGNIAALATELTALSGALALFGVGTAVAGVLDTLFNIGSGGSIAGRLQEISDAVAGFTGASDAMITFKETLEEFLSSELSDLRNITNFANNLSNAAETIRSSLDTIIGTGTGRARDRRLELLRELQSISSGNVPTVGVAGLRSPAFESDAVNTESLARINAENAGIITAPVLNEALTSVTDSFNSTNIQITNPNITDATIERLLRE